MTVGRVGMCFLDRPDPRRQVALSVRMEELGYHSVWVCETRTARDAISVMGAIAYATHRIKLGSGVVNSWTRPASLMSLTFATLDELAPDRMLLGIGAYWDPLAWKQGIDRRKPVKQMREYIEVTRRLLNLETVTFEGELVAVRDLRLDLGYGVARVPKPVPIYVGATGPQMLALSGELADGVMLNGFTSLTYLADALEHIERGARRSGRQVDDLDLPQTIVIAMDEDEEKALHIATRMTTMYLGQQPHIALASGVDQVLLDRVREAMGGWPPREGGIAAAMPMVPVDVVRSLTAAGTPEQCLRQVAAYSIRPNIYPALLPVTENYEEIIEVFAPRRDHGLPSRGAAPTSPQS
ncbi:MAG: LLM class flavin-dependent oxidoreductase [bacterium]|nr:LLM class flavin-dependent oxidoreductase [bacterium]